MLCVPCAPVPARPAAEMTKKNQRPIIKICRSMEEQNERDDEIREATERLSNRELAEYKEIFRFFDKDREGSITCAKLGQVMQTLGWKPSEMELKELVGVIDQDGNGVITFNEFVWFSEKDIHDDDLENDIREAFRCFDKDGLGYITVANLTHILESLGDKLDTEETEEFMRIADEDGDGNVNYEEFVSIMFKKPESKAPTGKMCLRPMDSNV